MKFTALLLTISISILSSSLLIAQSIDPPKDWKQVQENGSRTLQNAESVLEIGPWKDLDGQSLSQILKNMESQVNPGLTFQSSKGVRDESVEGAWSVTRTVLRKGKKTYSVLYGCPGQPGYGRIFELTIGTTKYRDFISAGLFMEKVCKNEPKGGANEAIHDTENEVVEVNNDQKTQPIAEASNEGPISFEMLAAENAKIPNANRPLVAYSILEKRYRGLPSVLTYTAKLLMTFPNGNSTTCAKWNLITDSPTAASIEIKYERCKLKKEVEDDEKRLAGFEPGQLIDIAFGNVNASGLDYGTGSSSTLWGGDLIMTKDGRIEIGEFAAFSAAASSAVSGGSNRSRVSGWYYLNGFTITIGMDDGEVIHGFIGSSSNKGSSKIDHVFLAGTHYWDRKKD